VEEVEKVVEEGVGEGRGGGGGGGGGGGTEEGGRGGGTEEGRRGGTTEGAGTLVTVAPSFPPSSTPSTPSRSTFTSKVPLFFENFAPVTTAPSDPAGTFMDKGGSKQARTTEPEEMVRSKEVELRTVGGRWKVIRRVEGVGETVVKEVEWEVI